MGIDPDVTVELTRIDQQLAALSNQGSARDQRINELANTIAGLGTIVTALGAKHDALAARVAKLEEGGGPVDPPTWTPRFPGDVQPGQVRWGAAVGGNSDPKSRHEDAAGRPMGLRRTFFAWRHIASGYLMDIVQEDHGVGRLPWVSIKPPSAQGGTANGWASIAAGHHDDEIDALLEDLDAGGKPVWLTFHHEPENDGLPAADWRAMQAKVRERITATGVDHVAFAGILMSWTYDPRSGRDPADWWVDGAWDLVGIDHYVEDEATLFVDPTSDGLWARAAAWLDTKDIPYALGEWGNRGTDAAAGADVQRLYDLIVADDRFIGAAAFDSGLNAPLGSYELRGEQLAVFRAAMVDGRSLTL